MNLPEHLKPPFPSYMTLPGGVTFLDAEAQALEAARLGQRVLIVGGIGSRGDLVAGTAAVEGSHVCGHVVVGGPCTALCHVMRAGPEVGPACAQALPRSVAAWSQQPASEVVPLVLRCWFDSSARMHRASLSQTSAHMVS
jgi:hypothetical protein